MTEPRSDLPASGGLPAANLRGHGAGTRRPDGAATGPESVYRRLQRHLDRMPIAYPATESGVELSVLEHLFSPAEAELALCLSALPEPVARIRARAGRAGLEVEGIGTTLDRLARRGAILRTGGAEPRYSKAMLAIGMFELQVDHLTRELAADVTRYLDEGFKDAFHTTKTSQMRTIPINEEVIPERGVGTYDQVRELVRRADGPFAVLNCVCRQAADLLDSPCRQTEIRETCLLLGDAARTMIGNGTGRELTRDGLLELVERADREGMVLQPQNTQEPHFICCCCGCCCGVLSSAKKLPRPADYFDTNYYAEVDRDLCVECGACLDRCQMDAIDDRDGDTVVDRDRCIGCGLCVSACDYDAVRLQRRPGTKTPPRTQNRLYTKITMERYGLLGTAGMVGKNLLGMKV